MTGQIPDPTVDSDAELDLPPPLPVRIIGLLVSLGAAVLGLMPPRRFPYSWATRRHGWACCPP